MNGIAPGFFPSKMASGIIASVGGEEKLSKMNPNGRLGRPEDIAGIVVFLCSRAAGHVNGDTVVVDGGKMLAGGFCNIFWERQLLIFIQVLCCRLKTVKLCKITKLHTKVPLVTP